MSKLRRLASTITLSIGLVLAMVLPTYAATQQVQPGSGNGIQIAPVRTDLTIQAGTSQTVSITVRNLTSQPAVFQAIVNDFQAGNNENGQPSLLLDNNQYAPSHSLKRYISNIPNVSLDAGQSKQVKVVINVPQNAAGGGYFGAVRFTSADPANTNQSGAGATLSASVGSLILVKVPGDIKDDLRISSFDVRNSASAASGSSFFVNNKSLNAVVRFNNQGNVQEEPFGKILLKKGSKILQSTEINNVDPRGNVLPASIRRFSVPLKGVGSWGKYTVEGNFGYGTAGQLLSASSTFYVVPVALIIAAVVIIVLIVSGIILIPRSIKRYNQRILRRAGRR